MQTARRVLVVEDERHLALGIAENLEAEGLTVEVVGDGRAGLDRMVGGNFDLVVLDVMLPRMDGFTLCEIARARGEKTPVLFLTARGAPDDRIRGLEAGADDYLAKPFRLRELLLRVQAILRRTKDTERSSPLSRGRLAFGGNRIDLDAHQAVAWNGEQYSLTAKEAGIIALLSEQEGRVVSRDLLLDRVWGGETFPSARTIDNFLLRLRKRFEREPEQPRHFHTVRGVGYRFTREPNGALPQGTRKR